MHKDHKRIRVVRTSLYGCSSLSQVSSDAIFAVLQTRYNDVQQVEINTAEDLNQLIISNPDLVFLGFKSLPAVDGHETIWVSDELERNNVQHTGSDHISGMLERNKDLSKHRVQSAGLNTADYVHIDTTHELDLAAVNAIGYPLFVKPASLGGGEGINSASVVHDDEQLQSQISALKNVGITNLVVEKYLPGREFSVAVLRRANSDFLHIMPIELIADVNEHGDRLLSQQVKSENGETVIKLENDENRMNVCALAEQVFNALGARDYARIDIRCDLQGLPYFLEANLIPSLIEGYGSFPKACMMNLEMDYESMITNIVNLGLERSIRPFTDTFVPEPIFA